MKTFIASMVLAVAALTGCSGSAEPADTKPSTVTTAEPVVQDNAAFIADIADKVGCDLSGNPGEDADYECDFGKGRTAVITDWSLMGDGNPGIEETWDEDNGYFNYLAETVSFMTWDASVANKFLVVMP